MRIGSLFSGYGVVPPQAYEALSRCADMARASERTVAYNPDMTPERYAAELDAWWTVIRHYERARVCGPWREVPNAD